MVRAVVLASLLVAAACSDPPRAQPSQSGPPSPAVAAASPSASPSPTATATPTASSAPAVARDNLDARFHPLVAPGWRPTGPTVVLEAGPGIAGTALVAVPVTTPPSSTTALASFGFGSWQLRADATALAISIEVDSNTTRLATWDLRAGTTRWVTADEPAVQVGGPVWSSDGAFIYYGAHAATPFTDLGIFGVGADGRQTRIHGPDGNGGEPMRLTPDGRGLVWARTRAGGSAEVLDLGTGANRGFDPSGAASAVSWRAARPRALVLTGNCCAGLPGGALHLWDDIAGTETTLLDPTSALRLAVGAADWDPSGTRIAAAVYDRTAGAASSASIVILDPATGARRAVPGTDGVVQMRWLPAGIVYSTSSSGGTSNELILVAPDGSAKVTLYRGDLPFRIGQVIQP
jgi:hypothetical protein